MKAIAEAARGVPGHGKIEFPELAEAIWRMKCPLFAWRQGGDG